jgi:uncharacterized sulfatase
MKAKLSNFPNRLGLFCLMLSALVTNAAERSNVLFFAFDDLRPLISAYGDKEAVTPNLDRLAGEGVQFNRSYVAYPLCKPSRATMLNGLRFDNAPVNGKWPNHSQLIGKQTTWPRVLRDAGYWTASRGKIYHGNVPGVDRAAWDIPGGKKSDWNDEILAAIVDQGGRPDQLEGYLKKGNGAGALAWVSVDGPDNILNDGQVCDDVISYIREQRDSDKPFAIACGFSRPHMPWVAPKKYFDLYPEDAGELAYIPEGAEKVVDPEEVTKKNNNALWNEGVDDAEAKGLIRGYMACVSYVDAQMGKVIQALKEEGLYDNTIIVAWGDHGYHLTDHGLWRKNTAYNVSLRAPLIIKAPGIEGGRAVDKVVGNVDLYPTLMELTGVTVPADVVLHGKSLVPLLKDPEMEWENITYTCAKERYGLVTDQYRFTVSENGNSLYDLMSDPHEWVNLAGNAEYATLVKEFEKKLETVVWNEPSLVKVDRKEGGTKPPVARKAQPKTVKKWDWFAALDTNKDGLVTEKEWLNRARSKAKKKGEPYEEKRQKRVFANFDRNNDAHVTRDELEQRSK